MPAWTVWIELAAAREARGEPEIIDVAPLGAGLENATVAIHAVGKLLALANRHAARLLAINILARLRRQDRGHRMPAIARGDEDGVDVGAPENLGHLAGLGAVLVLVVAVDHHANDFAPGFLNIGIHHELHVGLAEKRLQVLATARANSNAAEHDAVARSDGAVLSEHGGGNDGGHAQGQGRGFQEVAARGFHV